MYPDTVEIPRIQRGDLVHSWLCEGAVSLFPGIKKQNVMELGTPLLALLTCQWEKQLYYFFLPCPVNVRKLPIPADSPVSII